MKEILEAYTGYEWTQEFVDKFNEFYYIGRDKNETILELFKNAPDGRLIFEGKELNKQINSRVNDFNEIYKDLTSESIPSANLIASFVHNLKIDKNGKITNPSFKNQKFGRVVSNFIKSVGVAESMSESQVNAFLQKYVQGVWAEKNELKKDEVLVLSINPIDFLTCSKGTSWTSCMNYEDGEYKSTIFNYLTMESAAIAFIAKKDDLLTKVCRSWVYIDESGVAVQHEYPNHNSLLLPTVVMDVLNQEPLEEGQYKITYKNAKNEGYVDLVKYSKAIAMSSSPRMIIDLSSTNLCLECFNETANNDICDSCGVICQGCECTIDLNTDEYFEDNTGNVWCEHCYDDGYIVWSDVEKEYIDADEVVWSEYHGTYLLEDEALYVDGDYYLVQEVEQCDCCGDDLSPNSTQYETEDGQTVCADCVVFVDDKTYAENSDEIYYCCECGDYWLKGEKCDCEEAAN